MITIVFAALTVAARAAPPALPLAPCASERLKGARCGTLAVPEDPETAGGRTIRLNVVVVPALQPRAAAAPLLHLEGGPGVAATGVAAFYLGPGAGYRRTRDVVLVDQRGSGQSNPLRCPALEARGPFDDGGVLDDVRDCRRALEQRADLGKYSTEMAARDIEAVRDALGYDAMDLWALSYGTRLAQLYLKRFPARVRSAVLVGLAPLDYKAPLFHAAAAQRVLDEIFAACQLDPDCAGRYPDLRGTWRSVLDRLDGGAVAFQARGPGGRAVEIRRPSFVEAFRNVLTTTAGQRRVPALVQAAARGDFGPLLDAGDAPAAAEGLYLTIACSEGGTRITDDDVRRHTVGTFLGDSRLRREREACAAWPTYAVAPSFYEPPVPRVPVLVVSGQMDHVTPPVWAEDFCATSDSCTLLRVPALGHGPFDLDQWTGGECLDHLMQRFYDDPARLDADCLRGMRPPGWWTPAVSPP